MAQAGDNEEIAEALLDEIVCGEILTGARGICGQPIESAEVRESTGWTRWPGYQTLWRWRRDPDFDRRYRTAYEQSAQALEHEALSLAMSACDKDSAAAARVKVSTLQWAAGKRQPKTYSERLAVDHSGEITVSQMSDEQLNAKLADLLAKVGAPEAAQRLGVAPLSGGDGQSRS